MQCMAMPAIDTLLAFGSNILIIPWWGWLIVAAAIGLVYWEMREF